MLLCRLAKARVGLTVTAVLHRRERACAVLLLLRWRLRRGHRLWRRRPDVPMRRLASVLLCIKGTRVVVPAVTAMNRLLLHVRSDLRVRGVLVRSLRLGLLPVPDDGPRRRSVAAELLRVEMRLLLRRVPAGAHVMLRRWRLRLPLLRLRHLLLMQRLPCV
jgi:hypothetical protein